jgi:hypothetical protein
VSSRLALEVVAPDGQAGEVAKHQARALGYRIRTVCTIRRSGTDVETFGYEVPTWTVTLAVDDVLAPAR